MGAPADSAGAVSVNLGLDLRQFRADLKQAIRDLDTTETKERIVTLSLRTKTDQASITRAINNVQSSINRKAKDLNERGIPIRPQFVVSAASLRDMRTNVTKALKAAGEKGQGIGLPIKLSLTQAEGKQLRESIEKQVNAGKISVGLDWHWNKPPPTSWSVGGPSGGGGTSGGGAKTSGGGTSGGGTAGGTAAKQSTSRAKPTGTAGTTPSTSGGTIRHAPGTTAAPASSVKGRPTGSAAPASSVTGKPAGAAQPPVVEPSPVSHPRGPRVPTVTSPVTAAQGTPREVGAALRQSAPAPTTGRGRSFANIVSLDTLKAHGQNYTPLEKQIHLEERAQGKQYGNAAPRSPNAGVRGARAMGTYIRPLEQADADVFYSPAAVAMRSARRKEYEQNMVARRASNSNLFGVVAADVGPRESFRTEGEYNTAKARAEMVHKTGRQTMDAFAGVTWGQGDEPDTSSLNALDPILGDAYKAYLYGDDITASAMARTVMKDYRATGELGSTPKQRMRLGRKIGKVTDPLGDVDSMDQRVLGRHSMASALFGLLGKAKRPSDASRRRAAPKIAGTKDAGFTNVSDIQMSDSEYQSAAGAAAGMYRRGSKFYTSKEAHKAKDPALLPEQLEALGSQHKLSRLRVPSMDKDANAYLDLLALQRRRLYGTLASGTGLGGDPSENDAWLEANPRANGGPVERYGQIQRLTPRAYGRAMRRGNASTDLLRQGFGAGSPERARQDRLVDQADALHARLGVASNELFPEAYPDNWRKMQGRAAGGPVRAFKMGIQEQVAWPGQKGPTSLLVTAHHPTSGEHMGSLELMRNSQGAVHDIYPYVFPGHRRKGVATALFSHAQSLGYGVNALLAKSSAEGATTADGEAFFKGRRAAGGWIEKLMRAGRTKESQALNVALGVSRGGTAKSGGAMREDRPWVAPGSAAADRDLAFRQGRATGGWVARMRAGLIKPVDYTAQVRGPGADLHPESYLTAPRNRQKDRHGIYLVGERGPEVMVPETAGWIIPNHLMNQLPKRANGGPVLAHDPLGRFVAGAGHWAQPAIEGPTTIKVLKVEKAEIKAQTIAKIGVNTPVTAATPLGATNVTQVGRKIRQQLSEADQIARSTERAQAKAVSDMGLRTAVAQHKADHPEMYTARQLGQKREPEGGEAPEGKTSSHPTAIQKVMARQSGLGLTADYTDRLVTASTRIAEGLQASPARALSTGLGQVAQNLIGGRQGILARAARASKAVAQGGREVSSQGGLRDQTASLMAVRRTIVANVEGLSQETVRKGLTQNWAALRAAAGAERAQAPYTERAVAKGEALSKAVVTPAQAFKSQAVGAMGIVGGTILFTAAMAAAQAALELFTPGAKKAVDALSGYSETAERVAQSLGAAILSAKGQVATAFAGQAGALGINASRNAGYAPIATYSQRLAGAQQMQSQVDLQRANKYAADTGVTKGLGTGFQNTLLGGLIGGIPVLGGLASLGQTPGAAEQLTNQLPENRSGLLSGAFAPGGPGLISGFLKSEVAGVQNLGNAFGNGNNSIVDQQRAADLATGNTALNAFNDNVGRVSKGLGQIVDSGDPAAIKATFDALAATGDSGKDLAGRLQAMGKAIMLPGGKSISSVGQANQFLAAGEAGATAFDPAQMLATLMIPAQAAAQDLARRSEFQRNTMVPISFAAQQQGAPQPTNALQGILGVNPASLNQAPHGPFAGGPGGGGYWGPGALPPGVVAPGSVTSPQNAGTFGQVTAFDKTGLTSSVGVGTTAVPAEDIASAGKYVDIINQARTAIDAAAAAGTQKMRELGVPQSVIDSVTAYGKQIADLRQGLENKSTAQADAQYQHDLAIEKRQLGDLVGMADKQSITARTIVGYDKQGLAVYSQQVVQATQLGKINREMLDIQRTGALAELAINRRTLEFNVALSRLNTPGSTPGERATRRAEQDAINAEAMAKQRRAETLNKLGVTAQNITIGLNLKDAAAQLQSFIAGHALTIEARGVDKAVAALQPLLAEQQAIEQSFVDQGAGMKSIVLGIQSQVEAATGKFGTDFNTEVDTNLQALVTKYTATLAALVPPALDPTGTYPAGTVLGPPAPGAPGSPGNAAGIVGTTNGATMLTVGEAAHEYVAVLKSPTRVGLNGMVRPGGPMLGGGGGLRMPGYQTVAAGPVSISFGDVHVRSQDDIDSIVRQVETALNRRAALLGVGSRH